MKRHRADASKFLLAGVSLTILGAALAAPSAATAVDRHYTASGDVVLNLFPYGGFDTGSVGPTDRAVYDRAGTGQSYLYNARTIGGALFLAPYTGSGFVGDGSPFVGTLTVNGVNGIGFESHVNQQITLLDRVIVAADQEWQVDSATGSIRQLSTEATRMLNLGGSKLTLNAVQAANYFQLDNVISGTGGLVITGAGTTYLTSANTYSGGTTISSGALQLGAGGTTGSIVGDIANQGVLAFNRSNGLTFAGAISGTGSVQQLGVGTTTLSGANSYTGGTTISAGVLQLGDGGTTGSIVGDIANHGVLAFNRSNGLTFAGAISGTGSVQQLGVGTTTLSGANSYTGGTTISAGVLQLGDGGTTGSIVGDIANQGVLAFNRSNGVTFAGAISGTGSVQQLGVGTTTLSGANSYTGGTTISAGGLQLGAGGTTGSIVGDIANQGVLAFNRSNGLTFAGAISGTGSVQQLGVGTTTLSGANSYTGGTTISAGVLQLGDGGTTGSIVGDIANQGVLAFNRSNGLTFAGAISGTGSVQQLGVGTTTLSGANSYTGGTTISAGVLQLGDGGTTGSIVGDIANQGVLAFNRSNGVTFAGAISGTGSVQQLGVGTTTLSGANSYTGGTTISAGTLVGSAGSFGSGAILNNAALVIDQPTAGGFANAIDGSGSFTKRGAGRLNYTGVAGLTGPTIVAAGTLAVNGSLSASNITVQSGGTLGGVGTVGGTSVQAGGSIAPGNSIGTLHVNGAFNQAAGSTYQVEVDPTSTASDLIVVSGAATLASGAKLQVIKIVPGDYRLGTVYTVLDAAGGVTGAYVLGGETTGVSAFLGLKDSYDARRAYLTVVQTQALAGVAETPNQGAVAGGIDSLPPGQLSTAVLNSPTAAAARFTFDQLSGDSQATAKGALVASSRFVRELAIDRVRCAAGDTNSRNAPQRAGCVDDAGRPAMWGQVFGGWGHQDAARGAGKVDQTVGGFLVGLDFPLASTWRLGMYGGYSHSEFEGGARSSFGESGDYHLGLYGGSQWGRVGLRFGGGHSWHDIETGRTVILPSFVNRLRAEYDAGATQAFAELGYRIDAGRLGFEPFANLAHVRLRTSAMVERGGEAALSSQANTTEVSFSTLGLRPTAAVAIGSAKANLRGVVGWRHAYGDLLPVATVSFAGGTPFTVNGTPIAKDAAVAELGLDLGLGGAGSFGFTYGGQYSRGVISQTVRAAMTFRF